MVKLFLSSFLLLVNVCHAFNSKNCSQVGLDPKGGGWGTHMVFGIFNFSVSSAQFVSSTGGCSMLGKQSLGREFYYANSNEIKEDFAKGSGEYAFAMARTYDCTQAGSKHFTLEMKKQYSNLEKKSNGSLDEELNFIEKTIKTDTLLKKDCGQELHASEVVAPVT